MKKDAVPIDGRVIQDAERFFAENKQAICDYAQQAGLMFEPGEKWSIDLSTGRGTYDPGFFFRMGFSVAESMWATCHEIEHVRDWRKDPLAYAELHRRLGRGRRRLQLLYHQINDIAANREEDRRFPAHWETREYLYRAKILRRVDHSRRPRHLQFVDGILRQKMLPHDELVLSDEVQAHVDRLRNIDGEGTDLIDLVSDPGAMPSDRFELIRDYIEPIYERLFYADVEERKRQQVKHKDVPEGDDPESSMEGAKGTSGKSEIEVEPEYDEALFSGEYDEASTRLPEALSEEEIREAIAAEIARQADGEKTAEQIAKEQFKALYGVSTEEVEDYAVQYGKIERHIYPLRIVFERIIRMRKEIRRRLKERTDEGVIMDPSLMAQTYIDVKSNIFDSRTQLKIRQEELDEHRPLDFEFTLICDLSASMNANLPGGKSYEQRLCAILITEVLDEFEKKLKKERLEKQLKLQVFTELRGFSTEDEELKAMSNAIDYYTRVKICRRLESCVGKRTADYKSLAKVASKVDVRDRQRIEESDLKKAVVLITDGGSDDVNLTREAKRRLIEKGVVVKAIQIGETSTDDIEKFRHVWGDDGLPCKDVSRLVPTIERLLEELLEELE